MRTPLLLAFTFSLCMTVGYAQIGIGTELPNISSELEVSSSSKGILIPRIELKSKTDKTTIKGTSYPESLLVYHTGTKGLLAGFYFWSTDKWNALISNTTLNHYIKEEALPDSVTIIQDNGDYIFMWKDKTTGQDMSMKLSDVIKKFETLTALKGEYEGNEAVLVYQPERGVANKIKLTELLKGSSVFETYIKSLLPEVAGETITTLTPTYTDATKTKTTGVYTYKNEKNTEVKINVIDDVNNNFNRIISDLNVRQLLSNYITKEVETVVTFKGNTFYVTESDGNGGTKVTKIELDALVKNAQSITNVVRFNKSGVIENILTKPQAGMIYYEYENENKEKRYITVSQDVSNDFETIVNQTHNKSLIENIAKTVKGNDNYYSTIKEEVIGKWDTKDVMRYIVKLNQVTSFTSVELPKAITGLVVDAKLINEATNSLTRGVISKQVTGAKTTLAIGTSGTIIPNNPAGSYYVIVEYVKE